MFKTTVSSPSTGPAATATHPEETANPRFLTFLLAAMTGLTALAIDMSLPAMPQLQHAFGASTASVQLTLSLFLLGFACGQLVSGPLSDRIGRRPVLLAGLGLFTVAGLLCAASPSLPLLVLFRCLQGMGASVGPVISRAVVRDRFASRQGAAVLSQITQIMIVAPLIAPTLGGHLLVHTGWPAIFLVLGGSGALLWLACWRWLPETGHPAPQEAARPAVAAGFRGVLSHRASLRHTLTICFSHAGMFAYISGSPFVFIEVFGIARENFGYYFALTAVCLMLGATTNRMSLGRFSPSTLLRRGVFVVFGAALLLLAAVRAGAGGPISVVAPMMLYLFGLGLVQPNATSAAMAPHRNLAGVASSVIGSVQTLGGAVAGYCVGAFYDHTPLSLAATVAVLGTLTFLVRERGEPENDRGVRAAAAQPVVGEA